MTWSPYPHYKDAGAAWLGEIPAHWTVGSFSKFGRFEGGSGFPHEFQGETAEEVPFHKVNALARATQAGRLKSRDDTVSRATARRLGAKVLPAYSVVFAKVGAALLLGRIASLSEESCIDNNMMAFLPGDKVTPEFARHLLAQVRFDLLVNPGAVPSVSEGQMKRLLTAVPPIKEQRGIAAFLDRETAKIDALIAKQEQLIATLREDRTATITHAVTKGLDADVEMVECGDAMVPASPMHWTQKTQLKRLASVQTGLTLGKTVERDKAVSVPYLRVANVQSAGVNLEEVKTVEVARADLSNYLLRAGDVLMTEGGDIDKLGRGCLWSDEISPCIHQNHVFAVRCSGRLRSEFLVYLLDTSVARNYFFMTAKKTTNLASTNSTTLGGFSFALPPRAEQDRIVQFLDGRCSNIDNLIAQALAIINTLREYRAALITDAVTGKIDVRGVA